MGSDPKTIVVTGISGYVGKWVAHALLARGYRVRGTLRDLGKQQQVMDTLQARLGDEAVSRLSFVKADLLARDDWPDALAGADAVMHVATHVVGAEPKDANSVIAPAVAGTDNVLAAAHANGISRVIITSSIATVGYGQGHVTGKRVYTEANHTDLDNMRFTWAYCIGKTRAEQHAWAFAEEHGMAVTTIHPGMILGPPLDSDAGVSIGLVEGLLTGNPPAFPDLGFSLTDVRDCADMHVAALESPEAAGQRYLCTSRYLHFTEIADVLRKAYPQAPVPSKSVPSWLMRLLVYWQPTIRQIIDDIGNEKHFDGTKGRDLLGRDYRAPEQTILDSAKGLIDLGLVPKEIDT